MKNQTLEQIKDILEAKDLRYYCDEKERIGAGFSDFAFMFHAAEEYLEFHLQVKGEVPEEHRPEVLAYLNCVNTISKEGHWEMQPDGTVCFRIFTDMSDDYVKDSRILQVMQKGISTMGVFGEGIKKIATGTGEPAEIFAGVVREKLAS